jgi:hypothetical protein
MTFCSKCAKTNSGYNLLFLEVMKESSQFRRYQPTQKFEQEAWKFKVQVFFSTVVLGLCIFQLVSKDGKDPNIALYWGGLSSVLAYWLPAPGQNKDEKEQMTIETQTRASTDSHGQSSNGAILAQSNSTTVTTESTN